MKTVWKYDLYFSPNVNITMPKGAKILSVQNQYDNLHLWALVDTEAPLELRTFAVFETGEFKESYGNHLATVQIRGFVWHVFETVRET